MTKNLDSFRPTYESDSDDEESKEAGQPEEEKKAEDPMPAEEPVDKQAAQSKAEIIEAVQHDEV